MSKLFSSSLMAAALLLLPAFALAGDNSNAICAAQTDTAAYSGPGPDYVVINQVLTSSDRRQRLEKLPRLIQVLESQHDAESHAASEHLRLALSQAQAMEGQFDSAEKTLIALPLESPLAPSALQQLAEIELLNKQPAAALRWLQQLAALFPGEPMAVQGMLRAAEVSAGNSLASLQEAARLADTQLANARYWEARSHQADFLDEADTRRLPDSLWRLARNTLTDPAFAIADTRQLKARQQMQCLLSRQEAHAELLHKNPLLLADIANTVGALEKQLQSERAALASRENEFLAAAAAFKKCQAQQSECSDLQRQRDNAGKKLTGWRNRIAVLERKIAFLDKEQKALPSRWQQDSKDALALAGLLAEERSESRQIMTALLKEGINNSLTSLEELTAQAHYQLALAQDPRLQRQMKQDL